MERVVKAVVQRYI